MAGLAATTSATASLQSGLLRSRVAAARREADQAESRAQNLRRQAEAQENVVQQAHRRVKTVESAAAAPTTAKSQSSTPAPQADPTYINTLAEVFQAAKPVLESDLSPMQKNIVESGLLETASKAWVASQMDPPSPPPYQARVFQSPSQVMGRLLNTSA